MEFYMILFRITIIMVLLFSVEFYHLQLNIFYEIRCVTVKNVPNVRRRTFIVSLFRWKTEYSNFKLVESQCFRKIML